MKKKIYAVQTRQIVTNSHGPLVVYPGLEYDFEYADAKELVDAGIGVFVDEVKDGKAEDSRETTKPVRERKRREVVSESGRKRRKRPNTNDDRKRDRKA